MTQLKCTFQKVLSIFREQIKLQLLPFTVPGRPSNCIKSQINPRHNAPITGSNQPVCRTEPPNLNNLSTAVVKKILVIVRFIQIQYNSIHHHTSHRFPMIFFIHFHHFPPGFKKSQNKFKSLSALNIAEAPSSVINRSTP